MLCFSFARLTAFRPHGDDLLTCAAAWLVSDAALTALFLLLPKGGAGGSLPGRAASAAAGGWLLLSLTALLAWPADSLSFSFPEFYAPPAVIAASAAAAAYCASMGLKGCARAACAAAVVTVIVLGLTAVGAADSFRTERIGLTADGQAAFVRQLLRQLTASAEFPLFILLRGQVQRPERAVLTRFAVQSVTGGGVMVFCAGVLGRQSRSGIPADNLSSYSKTSVIERFDGLILLAWMLCLILAAAALLIGLRQCAEGISKKAGRFAVPGAAALCAGGAIFISGRLTSSGGGLTAALTAAAMLLAAISCPGRKATSSECREAL